MRHAAVLETILECGPFVASTSSTVGFQREYEVLAEMIRRFGWRLAILSSGRIRLESYPPNMEERSAGPVVWSASRRA
jgi:hypothetical protein